MHFVTTMRIFAAIAISSLLFTACKSERKDEGPGKSGEIPKNHTAMEYDQTGKKAPSPKPADTQAKKAAAFINSKGGSEITGVVTFVQTKDGVRIIADVTGLKEGKHGWHIHEHGDCSAPDAASAGGHYNPTNQKHGGPDSKVRHVGDLGNLEADASGFAHFDHVDKVIQLDGPNSIIGKSIVVHESEDDLKTDPSGNSGARIGCGVIMESKI